ncbi:DUF4412 domain-containing protein [Verrucomicrobiota bacterium sgz303538]
MKRQLLALGALLVSTALLQADFVVTQKVEGVGGQTGDVTMKIKGDKIRTDLPKEVSSITDAATGEVITLMHAQKSYLRISAEQARALMERMQKLSGAQAGNGSPKLQPTGRKEKVGEWETEVFTTKVGEMEITYWIAKDFPNYAQLLESMSKIQQISLGGLNKNVGPDPKEFQGMPVKTEMTLGKKKITSTIVSVKEEPMNPAVFELPKDYKEISLPPPPNSSNPPK